MPSSYAVTPKTNVNTTASTTGVVHLYNDENNDCPLLAEGEGQSAFNRACDYQPNTVLVEKIPSQSTLLLTEDDCTESTTKSKWWVKLQATARETSTEKLSLQAILQKAGSWTADPSSDRYVAPYLKIIGAGLKDITSPKTHCALLQLPATTATGWLRTVPRPWQPRSVDQNAQCGDGALIALYSKRAGEFEYQCADLQDFANKPFKASATTTVSMDVKDTPKSCPAGQIVTGLHLANSYGGEFFEGATLTCASFRNTTATTTLAVSGSQEQNRWVKNDGHNSICERPGLPGPVYFLSSPNRFLTGLDLVAEETQWFCSQVTPSTGQ
ncbi:hypothetical protein [Pseudomonas typographi]|uniref:Uncharacterized protein n=1 Tax=Pseudomonas typographi TaxID=2715964 RepID=A0ABR7Z0W4_9PSED|nr:hypothetical protein [Pseudomonas typographi]MBD1599131.1 hypothetical protein [Pseudomonas typographi]